MNDTDQSSLILESINQEVQFISSNRAERNKRYDTCMNAFRQFLNNQTKHFESKQAQNAANKELISKAFQNTFQRVLASSDISIRKIKQTFNQKKIFWQNVIKMNSDINDIELKKEFYLQKRNAQEGYEEAIDRQKQKHKTYKILITNNEKKEQLRQYQQTNKIFEEKVISGTNTLHQWQNLINNPQKYASYSLQPQGRTVINQFVQRNKNTVQPFNLPPRQDYKQNEAQNSTLFLNNFQIRK